MEDRIDTLFQEWHRLGGAVLLAEVDTTVQPRSPEQVIAESTAYCRDSGRLTWVTLDWLVRHIDQIDEARLAQETRQSGDLSVLGVLCDAARLRNPHPKFERIIRVLRQSFGFAHALRVAQDEACKASDQVEPFFRRVARSRLALAQTQENALEVFRRWNYLCSELRYL
jgi:hypothetical protein